MVRQSTIKHRSQLLLASLSLQNMVVDLEPQHEESISGGQNLIISLIPEKYILLSEKDILAIVS